MLTKLKEAAEKATPGPWAIRNKNGKFLDCEGYGVESDHPTGHSWFPLKAGKRVLALLIHSSTRSVSLSEQVANGEYLELATPERIKALIAVAEAAQFYASSPEALESALSALKEMEP